MFTGCGLRRGPAPTLLREETMFSHKLTRSVPQGVSLPRRLPEKLVSGKAHGTLEYQASRNSSNRDLLQMNLLNFDTTALNEVTNLNGAVDSAKVPHCSSMSEDYRKALAALRQGRLIDDGKVFRQTFVIRVYEANSDRRTSLETIINFFLEGTMNHWQLLGLIEEGFAGATPFMIQNHLTWVITKYHVEVERYPTWPEAVVVDTWKDTSGKHGSLVDWLLREHGTGKVLARGSSSWAIMNEDTRRLSKMPEHMRAEIEPSYVTDKRRAVSESILLQRIPKLDKTAANIVSNLIATEEDLDGNNHVHNTAYIRWIVESIPKETRDSHNLRSITLEFRRECKEGDVVESLTNLEQFDSITDLTWSPPLHNSLPPAIHSAGGNGSLVASNGNGHYSVNVNESACNLDNLHFIHQVRMQAHGEEVVRGRSVWQRRD